MIAHLPGRGGKVGGSTNVGCEYCGTDEYYQQKLASITNPIPTHSSMNLHVAKYGQ